jgi:hypothetical protein
MPQAALTDGDLLKKTLRTTLIMLGTTALWLGGLSGVVLATTGSSSKDAMADSKGEKVTGPLPGALSGPLPGAPPGAPGPKGPLGPGMKSLHRPGAAMPKPEVPHTGDPI